MWIKYVNVKNCAANMVESQQNRVVACGNGKYDDIETKLKNKYTWQQVAEKNSENEAWIIVRDKVYDVTGMSIISDL